MILRVSMSVFGIEPKDPPGLLARAKLHCHRPYDGSLKSLIPARQGRESIRGSQTLKNDVRHHQDITVGSVNLSYLGYQIGVWNV